MLPCKECITQAICKTKVNNNELLTDKIKDLSEFCYLFNDYFPFFSGLVHGTVSYPSDYGITKDEWKDRCSEVYDYFIKGGVND